MYAKALRPASKEARRHARKAAMITLFALKHQRRLRAVNRATQQASRSAATARQVASNRKVHREARLAVAAIALANQRAREVGLLHAQRDRQLISHLQHARHHASKAMTIAQRASHRRRRVRRAAAITIGAGALGGAAYARWKLNGSPEPDAMPSRLSHAAQPTADSTPPTAPTTDANDSRASGESEDERSDV